MICKKCYDKVVLACMSYDKCQICGERTASGSSAKNIICEPCAKKNNLCEKCGDQVSEPKQEESR